MIQAPPRNSQDRGSRLSRNGHAETSLLQSIVAYELGLTPDEVRDLDGYCRDRFIDLVPALATFGHMGRILSMNRPRQGSHTGDAQAVRRPLGGP